MRIATASGLLLAALVLAALSPWMRVRAVSWTGPLELPENRYLALESACLGQPLLLLSERSLATRLGLDRRAVRIDLRRHIPGTLEVHVAPRSAIARLGEDRAVDAQGRVLDGKPLAAGLPLLVGLDPEPNAKRLSPEARRVLAAVGKLLEHPGLVPSQVRFSDDELELVLADSGTRVRCNTLRADEQLLKLRIYEQSLGDAPLPASIDLRFEDEVVVREGGPRDATRRKH